MQQRLYDEFKQLDLDDDGNISFEEIVAFIKANGIKADFLSMFRIVGQIKKLLE